MCAEMARRVSAGNVLRACTSASNCATPGGGSADSPPGVCPGTVSALPAGGGGVCPAEPLVCGREPEAPGGGVSAPSVEVCWPRRPFFLVLLATITRGWFGSANHAVVS